MAGITALLVQSVEDDQHLNQKLVLKVPKASLDRCQELC
jgi:hypothetical protein